MKAENIVKGSFRNIVKAYNNATESSIAEGTKWYPDAHLIALQVTKLAYSTDVRVGAGILASLSPALSWEKNVEQAIRFTGTGKSTQTKANNDKAIQITCGVNPDEVLGGYKVTAFYHAILNPTGQYKPVIDRHALAVYFGKTLTDKQLRQCFGNPRVMKRVQHAYLRASKVLDVHYNVVQAVTWVQHRKNKGLVRVNPWDKEQR